MSRGGCCSSPACGQRFARTPTQSDVRWCGFADAVALLPLGSAVLGHYLQRVYGAASQRALIEWNWSRVDVLWLGWIASRQRRAIQNCSWPHAGRAARLEDVFLASDLLGYPQTPEDAPLRDFTDAVLMVHQLPRRGCVSADGADFTEFTASTSTLPMRMVLKPGESWLERLHGGHQQSAMALHSGFFHQRYAMVSQDAGWVEVVHYRERPLPKDGFLFDSRVRWSTWMYAARGSGVWYRMRRTLFVPTHKDACLEDESLRRIFELDAELQTTGCPGWTARLARHFDTVVFTHRAEKFLGLFAPPEVVALVGGPSECPEGVPLARGWRGEVVRTCNCTRRASSKWMLCGE